MCVCILGHGDKVGRGGGGGLITCVAVDVLPKRGIVRLLCWVGVPSWICSKAAGTVNERKRCNQVACTA